jgi:hypothetical protein
MILFRWESYYSNWVHQTTRSRDPKHHHSPSSFLHAVQYTLAAQHLSQTSRVHALRVKLLTHVKNNLFSTMVGNDVSMSSIRALQIMSLWSGTFRAIDQELSDNKNSKDSMASDSELLISAAVRMASRIHLELDIQIIKASRTGKSSTLLGEVSEEDLRHSYERTRLVCSLADGTLLSLSLSLTL